MPSPTVRLSAVCRALDLSVDQARDWGNRGIITLERGKPGTERQLDGTFAMRLGMFNEMSKIGPRTREVWALTEPVLDEIGERLDDEWSGDPPVFFVILHGPGKKLGHAAAIGIDELNNIINKVYEQGSPRIIIAEVGQAIMQISELVEQAKAEAATIDA